MVRAGAAPRFFMALPIPRSGGYSLPRPRTDSAGSVLPPQTISWKGNYVTIMHRRDARAMMAAWPQPPLQSSISLMAAALVLPVDLCATPFETAVWHQLCLIPRGSTRSYGEIAARLGKTTAARAVGHANGANPLAVIIPCHRAIGSDGSLTGYRWGLGVKRKLLEYERALIQSSLSLTQP
jgi:O-6-methylguanine DNA methyltransferase